MSSESLYTTCSKCRANVMKSEVKCPNCGTKLKKLTILHWVGIGFASLIVLSICSAPDRNGSEQAGRKPQIEALVNNTSEKPEAQLRLIQIVDKSRNAYKKASNEIQKSQTRDARKESLAQVSMRAENWVGTLVDLDTNSDGLGVVTVEFAQGLSVRTWNNSLSDMSEGTLIQKNSPLYRKLATLNEGQVVKFTGNFYRSQEDYLKEVSLTQDGSMEEPSFLFRFENIDPL